MDYNLNVTHHCHFKSSDPYPQYCQNSIGQVQRTIKFPKVNNLRPRIAGKVAKWDMILIKEIRL